MTCIEYRHAHTVVSHYPTNLASRQKYTSDRMWRDNEVRLYIVCHSLTQYISTYVMAAMLPCSITSPVIIIVTISSVVVLSSSIISSIILQ